VRILARSLFGTDIERHVETIAGAMDDIGARAEAGLLAALVPPWLPTPQNRRARRGQEAIDDVITDLVERRRGDTAGRDDLLSTLIEAHDAGEIGREGLRDQLVTFLLAGHETTSLALTYTWYLLARHGRVRERLHAELDAELGGATPTMGDLAGLECTEKVVTESMRLYPPVYRVLRQTRAPVEIGGYELDAGTNLTLPQWLVHRDARWYEDPETFRPERWTDEFEASLPEYAYFPFGGGPRRCIGMRFATLEAKLVLATVAQRYELGLADPGADLEFQPGATVTPTNPVEMVPRER
jgi:cytochrome P450